MFKPCVTLHVLAVQGNKPKNPEQNSTSHEGDGLYFHYRDLIRLNLHYPLNRISGKLGVCLARQVVFS